MSLFYISAERVMGCKLCKSCDVKNCIGSSDSMYPVVEIHEIHDLFESPAEFVASVNSLEPLVETIFLDSPQTSKSSEKDPGSSHETGEIIPFKEHESSKPGETRENDTEEIPEMTSVLDSPEVPETPENEESRSEPAENTVGTIIPTTSSVPSAVSRSFADDDEMIMSCVIFVDSPETSKSGEKDPGSSHEMGEVIPFKEHESSKPGETRENDTEEIPEMTSVLDSPEVPETPENEEEEGRSEPAENTVGTIIPTTSSVPSATQEAENVTETNAELQSADRVDPRCPMTIETFNLGKVLGEGTFGKVFLAENKVTTQLCAIKTLKKQRIIASNSFNSVFKEKRILQRVTSIEHPFLVSLYGTFQTEYHLFFAMEYLPGGDLFSLLAKHGEFEESCAMFYTACVVLGLEELHRNNILHRDLKPENLMVDRDGYLKIVDYGLSKDAFGIGDRTRTMCGTSYYLAPEIVMRKSYDRAADWWALGVVIYVMLTYQFPFDGETNKELYESIIYDEVELYEGFSEQACDLIKNLLEKDAEYRLGSYEDGAETVKGHNFFQVCLYFTYCTSR
ncbi:serine/threonine-protein kinase N1-like isoform X1 [Xenopus laevis]|uniref:Serine/threonine-protein kinase N1-like isoform X1 n=2 Tax=Xenopus laevis TaxID=8355 RepID=A0A8J1MU89_XENLA|nr:serine/threonine-protein kinase N1-like isoform X1 [Xenopus laevis]